jgi:hypothetical protein
VDPDLVGMVPGVKSSLGNQTNLFNDVDKCKTRK